MTVINLYLCFLIQNAIFDYIIPHKKCSSLVLPIGQLFCLAPYRICVGRNSLLHILLTLIIKKCPIKCLQPAFASCQEFNSHLSLVSHHINIILPATRHPKFVVLE